MNRIDELKLAIYESSFESDDKNELLDIVESTDDEEILESVEDLLVTEATRLSKEINKKYRGDYSSNKSKAEKELSDVVSRIRKLKSIVRTTPSNKVKVSIESKIRDLLDQRSRLESELDDLRNKYNDSDKEVYNPRYRGKSSAKYIAYGDNGTGTRQNIYHGKDEKERLVNKYNLNQPSKPRDPGSFLV